MVINIVIVKSNYILSDIDKAFIILSFLHYNGIISDEKHHDMLSRLRPDKFGNSKLLRRVGTYHDKITDTWFNDENFIDVLLQILESVDIKRETMPVENFLGYVNEFINKNRNYCVDYLFFGIIEKFVDYYFKRLFDGGDYSYLESFETKHNFRVNHINYEHYEPFGYCCEDCDGDYEEYKQSQFKYYKIDTIKDVKNELINELSTYKTKDFYRNTNRKFKRY